MNTERVFKAIREAKDLKEELLSINIQLYNNDVERKRLIARKDKRTGELSEYIKIIKFAKEQLSNGGLLNEN